MSEIEKRLEMVEASLKSFAVTYQAMDDMLGAIHDDLEDLAARLDEMSAAMAPLPNCPPKGFKTGDSARRIATKIDKTRDDLAVYWCGAEWKEFLKCST